VCQPVYNRPLHYRRSVPTLLDRRPRICADLGLLEHTLPHDPRTSIPRLPLLHRRHGGSLHNPTRRLIQTTGLLRPRGLRLRRPTHPDRHRRPTLDAAPAHRHGHRSGDVLARRRRDNVHRHLLGRLEHRARQEAAQRHRQGCTRSGFAREQSESIHRRAGRWRHSRAGRHSGRHSHNHRGRRGGAEAGFCRQHPGRVHHRRGLWGGRVHPVPFPGRYAQDDELRGRCARRGTACQASSQPANRL
ncbi:hypothetical protein LTR40_011223, partial [Exophiala xenobiotica]